jgi:hypothetical protein
MNPFIQAIRCFFWNGKQIKQPGSTFENARKLAEKKRRPVVADPFSNDASPPGNKIRWHL